MAVALWSVPQTEMNKNGLQGYGKVSETLSEKLKVQNNLSMEKRAKTSAVDFPDSH